MYKGCADDYEKENKKFKGELEGLYRRKKRADAFEKHNREAFQAKLQKKEEVVGELQSKLQAQANALEAKDAELKNLGNSLQHVRRENQELKSWKTEQEKKTIVRDVLSTAEEFRTKIADLTYVKGQLENEEQWLTKQVQDQTKRIEVLKNAVLVAKMGALQSQMQSLPLREERDKVQEKEKPTETEDIGWVRFW